MSEALDLILYPAVRLLQRCLPGMRSRRWGRVIAIGSSGVVQPIEGLATSNAARAALAAYLKTLATEVAGEGVTVNMIIPGRFETARVAALDRARATREGLDADEIRRRSMASIPIGRYGSPAELGALVAYIAGDSASYITGSLLRVDGGLIAAI
jgi:3-oxoacyl-[acyl-carrier protein] reductase